MEKHNIAGQRDLELVACDREEEREGGGKHQRERLVSSVTKNVTRVESGERREKVNEPERCSGRRQADSRERDFYWCSSARL